MRCALYARVSTTDQTSENQVRELREYAKRRGWSMHQEFVDDGVSGSKQSRPRLDAMLRAAKRREVDAIVVWSLDRLGRNLKHLIGLLDDLHALNVSLVSLREGLDWSTPSGRLQAQLLGIIAEFERSRIRERVRAGLERAKAQGKRLGRPRLSRAPAGCERLTVREAARLWNVSRATAARRLTAGQSPLRQSSSAGL